MLPVMKLYEENCRSNSAAKSQYVQCVILCIVIHPLMKYDLEFFGPEEIEKYCNCSNSYQIMFSKPRN